MPTPKGTLTRQERMARTALRALLAAPAPHADDWRLSLGRRLMELSGRLARVPDGVTLEAQVIDGVTCEVVRPSGVGLDRVVVYAHGGVYVMGSPRSHRTLTTQLADAARATLVGVDYRLAPEHPAPAALDDVVAVTRAVRNQWPSAGVGLAGDSAGGGLALAVAQALRGTSAAPDVLGLISPWLDLTDHVRPGWPTPAQDPVLNDEEFLRFGARAYAGNDLADPLASPINGDLTGLPPIVVQWGTAESLADDSTRLCAAARQAGAEIHAQPWPGLWHVHQMTPGMASAQKAILDLAAAMFPG